MEKTADMSSVEFDTVFNTTFSDVVGLLEEEGFQSTPKLSLETEDERKCSIRLFQMTGAATLKLRLPSSVAVILTMARSPRSAERRPARPEIFAVGTQTCWKHAGLARRIQLNCTSCSPCLELSAAARHVCTVSFHLPKPSENSPLQPLLSSCQAREVIPSLRPFLLLLLLLERCNP